MSTLNAAALTGMALDACFYTYAAIRGGEYIYDKMKEPTTTAVEKTALDAKKLVDRSRTHLQFGGWRIPLTWFSDLVGQNASLPTLPNRVWQVLPTPAQAVAESMKLAGAGMLAAGATLSAPAMLVGSITIAAGLAMKYGIVLPSVGRVCHGYKSREDAEIAAFRMSPAFAQAVAGGVAAAPVVIAAPVPVAIAAPAPVAIAAPAPVAADAVDGEGENDDADAAIAAGVTAVRAGVMTQAALLLQPEPLTDAAAPATGARTRTRRRT